MTAFRPGPPPTQRTSNAGQSSRCAGSCQPLLPAPPPVGHRSSEPESIDEDYQRTRRHQTEAGAARNIASGLPGVSGRRRACARYGWPHCARAELLKLHHLLLEEGQRHVLVLMRGGRRHRPQASGTAQSPARRRPRRPDWCTRPPSAVLAANNILGEANVGADRQLSRAIPRDLSVPRLRRPALGLAARPADHRRATARCATSARLPRVI